MASTEDIIVFSDVEAEEFVIASIIIEPDWLDELDLDATDFLDEQMATLYQAALDLRNREEHIDELSIAREVSGKVPAWVIPKIISQVPTSMDCLYYAQRVKEMSRKRQVLRILEGAKELLKQYTSQESTDLLRATLDSLQFLNKRSRLVRFSNPRTVTSDPPTYMVTVSSLNHKQSVDIRFTSTELDNSTVFKRKIREKLQINPILPRGFDSLVDWLVRNSKSLPAPSDASTEDTIYFWMREWFKTAIEAEHPEDLTQGYIEREGAYWFVKARMLNYLREKARVKLSDSSFWPLIMNRGGRQSKVFSLSGKKVRLWGIDKKFFAEEEEEPAEGEQMEMKVEEKPEEEDDLSWLEEEK
jgi:hypothetical protein